MQQNHFFISGASGLSQIAGCVMQSQNFNIIATHAVNRDVVLVQDQFTGARHTAGPAHARMGLKFGHSLL